MSTEQEIRVDSAIKLKDAIECALLLESTFTSWEKRCRVNEAVNELYKLAIEPKEV